ncbi:MAG TPA: hypothetical protein VJ696_06800 [Rhodanobacteraceae bacterium]|nr:hypothetical protein [Rhodanobacteraceae bacterium]
MRRALFAFAVLASWAALVLWAADVEWSEPLAPAEQRHFAGEEFAAVFGAGSANDGVLKIVSPANDFTSLESLKPVDIDAYRFQTLRYRFADFPRTLELSLVFRTADDPDAVAISLPWPGSATRTFDLRQVPEWRGRIVEIGFAEFPTAQVVPPSRGFKPFDLVDAALWSPSWRGDLLALWTDWFGAWPWTQRSVHALGRDTDTPRALSLVLCVAIAVGIAIVWAIVLLGWRGRALSVRAAAIAAAGWIVLDATWQAGLWGRLQTTRAVYADLSWSERERTVGDVDIADAADRIRALLRNEPHDARILVQAGSGYEMLRLIWHLLPRNVADYAYAAPMGSALPEGCLIVFFDTDVWRTKPYWRQLLKHSQRLHAGDSIHGDSFEDDSVTVFRFRHGR